jgi:hypothetical protein
MALIEEYIRGIGGRKRVGDILAIFVKKWSRW